MDSFEVCKLVVIGIHADAEKEACVSTVDHLRAATEFHKVRLVFLISGRDKTMDLCGVLEDRIRLRAGLDSWGKRTSPLSLTFSSSCFSVSIFDS